VLRLYAVIDRELRLQPAPALASDMRRFLTDIANEQVDLKVRRLTSTTINEVIDTMRKVYQLDR